MESPLHCECFDWTPISFNTKPENMLWAKVERGSRHSPLATCHLVLNGQAKNHFESHMQRSNYFGMSLKLGHGLEKALSTHNLPSYPKYC